MTGPDPAAEVKTLREKLQSRERYVQFNVDREHLLQTSDNLRLLRSQAGDYRHRDILRRASRMAALAPPPTVEDFEANDEADHAGVATEADVEALLDEQGLLGLTLEYRAAAEAIVRWINDEHDDNEHTNQDYRKDLRAFERYRLKREEPPDSLAWIPTGTSNNFNPVPSERDLLTYQQDILPMLDECRNARDKALIAVQFEAGLRGTSELYDLRVGDIFDGEYTTGIHVDGKNGERAVPLHVSLPYLQQWLREHPARDNADAYLWSKLDTPEHLSYTTFLNYFKNAAKRAGVSKEVTPTNFRKSNTRWLVNQGYHTSRIEYRQGRKRGSEHTARYLARFGDESNECEYARLHGLDVEDEDAPEVGPVTCPRCKDLSPRHKDFCTTCQFALTASARSTVAPEVNSDDVQQFVTHLISEAVAAAEDGRRVDYGCYMKEPEYFAEHVGEHVSNVLTGDFE